MRILLSLALVFGTTTLVCGQIDTINAKNNKLVMANLKPVKNSYLVYMTDSLETKRTIGDIWERTITFRKQNQQDVVVFDWKWLHNDSLYATIMNVCDRKTLAPIYRYGSYKNKGVMAYNFKEGVMVPSDTVKDNLAIKRGAIRLDIPVISWEQDLETYSLLPITKVGQQFDISFFDPNEKAASYHRYVVIGKEALSLNKDVKINCWLLKINYTNDSYATFWLTEKSKEVIKMKEYYKGKFRVKVKQY